MARQRVCRAILAHIEVRRRSISRLTRASRRRARRSAVTAVVLTPRLTGARPIKLTRPRCPSAWPHNARYPEPRQEFHLTTQEFCSKNGSHLCPSIRSATPSAIQSGATMDVQKSRPSLSALLMRAVHESIGHDDVRCAHRCGAPFCSIRPE